MNARLNEGRSQALGELTDEQAKYYLTDLQSKTAKTKTQMESMGWLVKNLHLVTDQNYTKMIEAFAEISKKTEYFHARHGSDAVVVALQQV